jgi:hypothetical protein
MINQPLHRESTDPGAVPSSWISIVQEQIASLKFGTVTITVHDARVVQVEKSERLRLDPALSGASVGRSRPAGNS